ncbi:hypothetical protein [Tumebacillus lipolyticus]|uniref:DUF4367 domain-containing protein n=1 Tax=Tumebacillus lipolyticus TaxID=1280370 RepID=A0ABW4ZY60_9BACL
MPNKKMISLAILLCTTGILSACSSDETMDAQAPSETIEDATSPLAQPFDLGTISTKRATQDQKKTPLSSVFSQVEWISKTNQTVSPTEHDVLWKATIGKDSIVALKVPNTAEDRYNFFFLSNDAGEWNLHATTDAPLPLHSDTRIKVGIELPLERFITLQTTFGMDNRKVWTFAHGEKALAIGSYPHQPFSPASNAKQVLIGDRQAWQITEADGASLLYYLDQGQLVWLAGNFSESELRTVAAALASGPASFPALLAPRPL